MTNAADIGIGTWIGATVGAIGFCAIVIRAVNIIHGDRRHIERDEEMAVLTTQREDLITEDVSVQCNRDGEEVNRLEASQVLQQEHNQQQKSLLYDPFSKTNGSTHSILNGNGALYPSPTLDRVSLTYNMNILQHIPTSLFGDVLLTMNPPHPLDPSTIQGQYNYSHPLYTPEAVVAQKRLPKIQGKRGI
ncbi:MAG: hypothetical protein M1821_005579 [Bathelium mastoideum]|nr:MAG: hypothetical protein M1821_005579 [Bathelium mastoideum]